MEYERAGRSTDNLSQSCSVKRILVRTNTEPALETNADSVFDDLDSLANDLRARTHSMPPVASEDPESNMSATDFIQLAEENGKQRVEAELADYERETGFKIKSSAQLLQFWQVCDKNCAFGTHCLTGTSSGQPNKVPIAISCGPRCTSCTSFGCTVQARFFVKQRN